ncbi:MAG: sodium:proton antiporter NhaD [Spirosomataceae bacterium]|jgi:Na+/H+ antiporter NhaD/arsenite permease-like protein
METLIILIFIAGYVAIVLEHKLSVNKSASALLTGVLTWALIALSSTNMEKTNEELLHHVSDIASILFFLMGAMTIVEVVATYGGFEIITDKIHTRKTSTLLWIIAIIAFFMSAVLDNLTTTIVIIALLRKLIADSKTRLLFAGIVVIAANAGGAWTPIGDVTTTMLWIGGQITTGNIMKQLFLPSIVSLLVPLAISAMTLKGELPPVATDKNSHDSASAHFGKVIIFWAGMLGLLSVPVFKTLTHLPPFMGMMLSLGVIWVIGEMLIKNKDEHTQKRFNILRALEKVDLPSVLFFLGILLAVSALENIGALHHAAAWLDTHVSNQTIVVTIIGILSSIVDNVPLVAASMGMYSLEQYPVDHQFWELLAFCAGTGGSILIIGSAAGVAAMGLEKIEFFWYMKKISLYALIGYFAGIGVFLLQKMIFA